MPPTYCAKEIAKGVIPRPIRRAVVVVLPSPAVRAGHNSMSAWRAPVVIVMVATGLISGLYAYWRRQWSRRAVNVSLRTDLIPLDSYNTGSLNDQGIKVIDPYAEGRSVYLPPHWTSGATKYLYVPQGASQVTCRRRSILPRITREESSSILNVKISWDQEWLADGEPLPELPFTNALL